MCAVTLKNSRGDSQFELQNVPKRYQLLCYRAQNAFRSEGLFNDLVEILRYSAVLVHLKEVQCNRVGLRKGEQLVREFLKSLNEDADLLVYSKNRLKKWKIWRAFCEASPITTLLSYKMHSHPIRKSKDLSVNLVNFCPEIANQRILRFTFVLHVTIETIFSMI